MSFESSDGRALCPRTVKLEFDPCPWYLITPSSYLSANWNSNCEWWELNQRIPSASSDWFFSPTCINVDVHRFFIEWNNSTWGKTSNKRISRDTFNTFNMEYIYIDEHLLDRCRKIFDSIVFTFIYIYFK